MGVAIFDLVIAIGLFIYILAFGSKLSIVAPLMLIVSGMMLLIVAKKL